MWLRWGSPENPMKSAYLVAQGYANICKMVSMVIIHVSLSLGERMSDSNCQKNLTIEIIRTGSLHQAIMREL